MSEPTDRSPEDQARVAAAREKCFILYEGARTAHRSCGIALAETFGLATAPYQALRRGGLNGLGPCGAIMAGRLILGQLLGDPDPTGGVTDALRVAIMEYESAWPVRLEFGASDTVDSDTLPDIVCNHLTAPFADFAGAERRGFCTALAADVAEVCAEVLVRRGALPPITPIIGVPDFVPPTP